jgi:hypothetical protein
MEPLEGAQPLQITAIDSGGVRSVLYQLQSLLAAGDITTQVELNLMGKIYTGTTIELMDEVVRSQMARITQGLDRALVRVVTSGGQLSEEDSRELDQFATEIVLAREQLGPIGLLPKYLPELKAIDAQVDQLRSAIPLRQELPLGGDKSPPSPKLGIDANGIRIPPLTAAINAAYGADIPISKVIEQMMEEHFPELMRKFYPRIYEAAGRYHSPKQCAAYLSNVVAESLRVGFERAPTAYRLMMPALEQMAKRKMPMFFIAPDLLEAIERTDFADDIRWPELELPFEQGIFILPKGAWSHPEDGEVSMILWARYRPGDYPPPVLGLPPVDIGVHSMVLLCLCVDKAMWYDSTFESKRLPAIRLRNMFHLAPGENFPRAIRTVPYLDQDLTTQDQQFLEQLAVITFGTFMVMNAKPELVEHGKLMRRVVKPDRTREFWSPNVIGPRYKLKREVPRIVDGKFAKAAGTGGSHASPRMHWRRGHLRQQAHGPQRRDRKTIWIEPMLVGATTEE